MWVETSKEYETHSSLLNGRIAEGKRRYAQALSLQDVFSDPQNSAGIQQKTSRPVRKWTGLGGATWRKKRLENFSTQLLIQFLKHKQLKMDKEQLFFGKEPLVKEKGRRLGIEHQISFTN